MSTKYVRNLFRFSAFFLFFGWRHTYSLTQAKPHRNFQQRQQLERERERKRQNKNEIFRCHWNEKCSEVLLLLLLLCSAFFFLLLFNRLTDFVCFFFCSGAVCRVEPLGHSFICSTLMRAPFFDYFITIFPNILIFSLNCCLVTWSINWQGEMVSMNNDDLWHNCRRTYRHCCASIADQTKRYINFNCFHCDWIKIYFDSIFREIAVWQIKYIQRSNWVETNSTELKFADIATTSKGTHWWKRRNLAAFVLAMRSPLTLSANGTEWRPHCSHRSFQQRFVFSPSSLWIFLRPPFAVHLADM